MSQPQIIRQTPIKEIFDHSTFAKHPTFIKSRPILLSPPFALKVARRPTQNYLGPTALQAAGESELATDSLSLSLTQYSILHVIHQYQTFDIPLYAVLLPTNKLSHAQNIHISTRCHTPLPPHPPIFSQLGYLLMNIVCKSRSQVR